MDEIEIRRLYMEDDEWERTSETWKSLKPRCDFNQSRETDETEIEYYHRLQDTFSFPLDVIEQWLYPHYYNVNTINNYGWLDYSRVAFTLTSLSAKTLSQANVIAEYEPWVENRSTARSFSEFMCRPEDDHHWRTELTWRIPPIVIDVISLPPIPDHAELRGPLQLVEGHTRLGYLIATVKCGVILGDSQHSVYMMHVLGA
jgi:hypothetical protein